MATNLKKFESTAKIPAALIEGTEAFYHNGKKYVTHRGQTMLFENAPGKIQRMIATAFMNDTRRQRYLKKIGVVKFSEAFEMWYRCVIGAYDETPDFANGQFTSDAFNSNCCNMQCPHRGKFCSTGTGLKPHEIDTLLLLQRGHSVKETAEKLFISVPGMKSRVEKLKLKLDAPNMAALMAKATQIGLIGAPRA